MTCTLCRLHETCRTVKVASRGSEHPTVMFVGEAPGREEDQKGKAFVGPAGQLLEQAIKEYGLTPAFITNVVRCNPPGDRQPRVDEVTACIPYLKEEIRTMRPKVIVALGNTPLRALTGLTGVSSFSGTVVKEVGGIKIFSLFHPSFILRVPGMLPKFEMHLRELERVVNGEAKAEPIPVMDLSPREAFEMLEDKMELLTAFDYETTGLFKGTTGHVRLIGFSNGAYTWTINAEKFPDTPKFMKWFLKSDIPKVAYNSAFEARWSLDEYGVAPNNLVHDPYLLHYLLDENSSRDLESVASQYLKAGSWGIEGLMREKGWTHETIPIEALIPYCGTDAFYTLALANHMRGEAGRQGLSKDLYKNMLTLAQVCAELERTGIKIDKAWAADRDKEYEALQSGLLKKINRMEVVRGYVKQKRLKHKGFEFNPGSAVQLRDLVFGKIGLYTEKKTKKGGLMSTDQDTLEELKGAHPFIPAYLDWKGITTTRNNFLVKFPTYCDGDDLVHPSYNPAGTVTGRLAATEPPAHTFDQAPAVRGMVISRFPKGKLISNDYSQLELRLLASEAEEEALLEAFAKGKDPHGMTAERMFGKGFTKDQRAVAKTLNFGIAYGLQAKALSRKFHVGYEEAEEWLRHFQKSYPKIYIWMERQHDFVRKNGWIKSQFGRVRHLPEVLSGLLPKWQLGRTLRQAGNFPIQSQGADINNLACIKIAVRIESAGLKSRLFLPIHDSIMIDSPPSEITQAKALCRGIMEDEMQEVCTWLKVKLKIDQVISVRWGN